MTARYGILGGTQALRSDGTPVALGGARLRALLAALALRPGRAVPVDLLVDGVWDGDPPRDAPGALLRRHLPCAARRRPGDALPVGALAWIGGITVVTAPLTVRRYRDRR